MLVLAVGSNSYAGSITAPIQFDELYKTKL